MKYLTACLLILCMIFTLASIALAESPQERTSAGKLDEMTARSAADMEFQRALAYGFVPGDWSGDWDNTVTYNEFCKMLFDVMTMTDPALQAPWPQLDTGLSEKQIDRQEAMIACMLAGLEMGLDKADDYDEEQNLTVNIPTDMGSLLYPDCYKPITISTDGNGNWDDYIIAGAFYCIRQSSMVSDMPLFTLIDGDLRTGELITRGEAILAAVRLYESVVTNAFGTYKPSDLPVVPFAPDLAGEDSDIQKAFRNGIVPEKLMSNRNAQITYKQYCLMLRNAIAILDKDALAKWDDAAALALVSDRKILRQEGMLAMYYAAEVLGAGDDYNRGNVDLNINWNQMTYDYPEFPNWADRTAYQNKGFEHVMSAYGWCINSISDYTCKHLFEIDEQRDSFRVADAFTVEEAIKSVQRFMESVKVLKPMDSDMALTNTISPETIEAGKKDASRVTPNLPKWYGYAYALWDNPYVGEWRYFSENTIKQLHDTGFNFLRMVYHLQELFIEKDGQYLVNVRTFQNLDEIIAWCAKYDMHITVQMHQIPGYGTNGPAQDIQVQDILQNPKHYRQALEIYDFMSKRYANVPSNLLSFTLLSEPDNVYFSFETHAQLVEDLAAVIRKNSPDRLIMAHALSTADSRDYWVETCIKMPNYFLDSSIVQLESFYAFHGRRRSAYTSFLNGWPYDEAAVVNNSILPWDPAFTLKGNFKAGTQITLFVTAVHNADPDAYLLCKAGNKEVGRYSLTGFAEGAGNCNLVFTDEGGKPCAYFGDNGYYNGLEVTFALPKKATSVAFSIKGVKEGAVFMSDVMIKTPSDTEQTYMVVDNRLPPAGINYQIGKFTSTIIHCSEIYEMPPSTVTIQKDGTYTCKQKYKGKVFDLDSARDYFDMWEEWSQKTGGSYFDFEFCSLFSMPKAIRMEYMRSQMELFKEYDIGWTFSADTTGGGGIILYKGAENMTEFNSDAPKLILPPDGGYSVNDDYDYPCYYDDTVIAVMQEYMK